MELAQETRELKQLPLNEKARIALRDSQEEKALTIENKRRKAQGEELLSSLEQDEEDTDSLDPDESTVDAGEDVSEEEEDDDVLLLEAGHVLVDVLLLKEQNYAVHHKSEMMR